MVNAGAALQMLRGRENELRNRFWPNEANRKKEAANRGGLPGVPLNDYYFAIMPSTAKVRNVAYFAPIFRAA